MSSQVEVRIPHWSYLSEADQEWLRRELKLTVEGRDKTLVLHCARTRELRKDGPHYLCYGHAEQYSEDYSRLRKIPVSSNRCDQCENAAVWYVADRKR